MYSGSSLIFLNGWRCCAIHFSIYTVTIVSSTLIPGIFTIEALNYYIRSLTILKLPCCEEAKPQKYYMQIFWTAILVFLLAQANARYGNEWAANGSRPTHQISHSFRVSLVEISSTIEQKKYTSAMPYLSSWATGSVNIMGCFKPLCFGIIWYIMKVREKGSFQFFFHES